MRALRWLLPGTLLLLVGCAMFARDPGPDGVRGTADDPKSKAEKAADDAAELAGGFGFGWIGTIVQVATTLASTIATARLK